MAQVIAIGQWYAGGIYYCPSCLWRISGTAWSLARADYTCPHCGKRNLSEFKREKSWASK